MTALDHWQRRLAEWAIPADILAQAPTAPYRLDPAVFRPAPASPTDPPVPGLATTLARERLPEHGTVLDVGCGGGAAGLALAPPAVRVTGVDESPDMLSAFAAAAAERHVDAVTVEGRWPDVGERNVIPTADVVVCHHVAYNVADLDRFALALSRHARRRVVLELTPTHPQTRSSAVWLEFWGVVRPDGPTSADALAVLIEAGIDARLEHDTTVNRLRAETSPIAQATQVARNCCLGPDRVDEVAAFLAAHPPERRPPDVIWWDVDPLP